MKHLQASLGSLHGHERRARGRRAGSVACFVLAACSVLACGLPAEAQWVSQALTLKPGWNAVFLEVEPLPGTCETVFAGIPIESVWYWAPNTSSVQFITNPDKLEPASPDWRVYFPSTSLASTLTTLRVMRGNRPYLINLGGTADVAWTVRGTPSVRSAKWIPNSYNLAGFQVDPANAPTFESLFSSSVAHVGQAVLRLNAAGQWEPVAATAKPGRGEAFWVYTTGESTYQGPIPVTLDMAEGLAFGRGLTELTFSIKNDGVAQKTYTVTPIDSETPGDPTSPALSGTVPLSYHKDDYAGQDVGWRPLTAPVSFTVAAGEYRPVKLALQRNQMAPSGAKADGDSLYQSILEVADGQGSLVRIPVTARGTTTNSGAKAATHPAARKASAPAAARKASAPALTGLWVGTVTVKAVNEPAGVDKVTPQPTGSEFSFQIIVHVDAAGTPKLLQHVTQMWKEGTSAPAPVTPGSYVLITDDTRLGDFKGSGERGGVSVGRRFSCPAFGFRAPIAMTGTFPTQTAPTGSIGCTYTLDYDDPLNPFKHKYHPDHDNLDARYENVLPEGMESFTVTRAITLEFVDYSAASAEGTVLLSSYAGWGDSWIGGTYKETITGIHRDVLHVEGTFQLNYVSDATQLNPEK